MNKDTMQFLKDCTLAARIFHNDKDEEQFAAIEAHIIELQAKIEALEKDAARYKNLRRMAVELSLSHAVISQLVTNQAELDAAIKGEQQ